MIQPSLSKAFRYLPAVVFSLASLPLWPAAELTWNPPAGSAEDAVWDASSPNWMDESGQRTGFESGGNLQFPGPAETLEIMGKHSASDLAFAVPEYLLLLDNDSGDALEVAGIQGRPWFGFEGVIGADADGYPAAAALRDRGLIFFPQGPGTVEAEIRPILGGSPLVGVRGKAGRVDFAGDWFSDSGSILSWLHLDEGGHFRITEAAGMHFIKEGFFTLQLWVAGDGSGILELAEGFVADHTDGGLVRDGLGSIRMGAGTFISHDSASLPLGYRPRPDGTAQTNGHLVFENRPGTRWIVRTQDQVYPGAVWIFQSMELVTEADLVHAGVSEPSPDYTARNGWSVLGPATVTKKGSAALVLKGEQSYARGAYFEVLEGTLVMGSDPATGHALDGTVQGAQLTIQVGSGAELEWQTEGAIQSLLLEGTLLLNGRMRIENGGLAQFGTESRLELLLREGIQEPAIEATGPLFAGGKLVIERLPEYLPPPGSEWILAEAPSISGNWELEDRTGLDLELVREKDGVRLVSRQAGVDLPGRILLEDNFDHEGASLWKDLSVVPRWGNPPAHGSAFEWRAGVVRLRRSGERSTLGHTRYGGLTDLKTFTALDYRFEDPVRHGRSELTVDFRLRWPQQTEQSGEAGRFLVLLNHDYPEGGLDLTPEGEPGSRVRDFSREWWARPAYHVRLRNSTTRAGSSFLQYGGGMVAEGEYERTAEWWLPGFVSGAGQVVPGSGDDFPANSWIKTREGMASADFTSFRYRILPDRQELWRDDNDNGFLEEDELKAVMPLPRESEAPLYRYFEDFEGIRLFWNGRDNGEGDPGQAELDWFRVIHQNNLSPVADAGEDQSASILLEGQAPLRLDASRSRDPEEAPLLYVWMEGTDVLSVSRLPESHLFLPEGEYLLELLVLDKAGNHASDSVAVSVIEGKARPEADPGPGLALPASNDWFGLVRVTGAASSSPNGEIVRYRWTTGVADRVLYEGPAVEQTVALGIGTHELALTVWDEEGLFTTATQRIVIEPMESGEPEEVIYRENFSRSSNAAGEMGPDIVGWNLMRFDGEPVAAIKFDGNAHRSLVCDPHDSAPWLPKVNANPMGSELTGTGTCGHMWMNQMHGLNASPGEWMLWTEEYPVDTELWDLAALSFHSSDGSPERVKVAPAVRIAGEWFIGWELRVETRWDTWREYTIPWSRTGWVRFDPSILFSVRDAVPIERLPNDEITAFGLYFFKDFAWYVNEIDNVTLKARPSQPRNSYGDWVAQSFPQEMLTDAARHADLQPQADADRDGLSNLWAYALGRSPVGSDGAEGGFPVVLRAGEDEDGWELQLPWNPVADNVVLEVHTSKDLQRWDPEPSRSEVRTDPENGEAVRHWFFESGDDSTGNRFFTFSLRLSQ